MGKMLLKLCILVVSVTISSNVHAKNTRLFILSGQSNMVGLNPDLSFTPMLQHAFPHDDIIVIKDAENGQPIRCWYKQAPPQPEQHILPVGFLYKRLISKVKASLSNKQPQTIAFIWMQGERDAIEHHGNRYGGDLEGLIQQLQHDLGRDDIAIVIGRLSDFGLKEHQYHEEWEKIRHSQVRVAGANSLRTWVDTDDLNGAHDDLHYTAEGYQQFGTRLAQAAIHLINQRQQPYASR